MVDVAKREDALLDTIAELIRKRDATLKRLDYLINQDPTLEVFADDLRLRLR